MKLNSKYFDSIRVKPSEDRLLADKVPTCEWPECESPGKHPAPKGRDNDKEYHYFCLRHVREYNKDYNYFNGMKDKEVKKFIDSSRTGHRPTWKLGDKAARKAKASKANPEVEDPFDLVSNGEMQARPRRAVRNQELKALYELGLDETATAETVTRQYKVLIKRLHPDANKGSRENEDKLANVIKAHEYLKNSGFMRKTS
jgi:hypothetical protein